MAESEQSSREVDEAARSMDPAQIMSAQQERVRHALDADEVEGREELETYVDLERRVILDMADRVLGDQEDTDAISSRHDDMLAPDPRRDPAKIRRLFDEHVRATEPAFRALWSHLDDTGSRNVAAALEEARLSRQEGDTQVRPPAG